MRSPRELVKDWPTDHVRNVLHNWDAFERDGVIGSCPLRTAASEYLTMVPTASVTTAMRDIAFECYRRLAVEKD